MIELKDGGNVSSTPLDVVKNPKNLKFKEIEAASLPRVLTDVDAAAINGNYAIPAGLSVTKDSLFVEGSDSPYVNIIVACTDNKDSKAVQDFVKAYQTPEVEQEAKKHFKDGVVKGW